jgi:hypothetical protein
MSFTGIVWVHVFQITDNQEETNKVNGFATMTASANVRFLPLLSVKQHPIFHRAHSMRQA